MKHLLILSLFSIEFREGPVDWEVDGVDGVRGEGVEVLGYGGVVPHVVLIQSTDSGINFTATANWRDLRILAGIHVLLR